MCEGVLAREAARLNAAFIMWIRKGRPHVTAKAALTVDGKVAGPGGSRLAPGARVEGSVLWERVEVGRGATLRDCVVGSDVKIGDGAELAPGTVVQSGAAVAAGARLPSPA